VISHHRRDLVKPDGRRLWLYSRHAISQEIEAVSPEPTWTGPNPHLRFHPLRGEWVVYAGHRQERTFLPPPGYNPLAPSADPSAPTELPCGAYDVAVFENRFPTFFEGSVGDAIGGVPTLPARGSCEVVVYSQTASVSFGNLPLWNIELILAVWRDRTRELGARADVVQVFPFENRGVEMGVTLQHPHGQIYAYPFLPPLFARELALMRKHYETEGVGLLASILEREVEADVRTLALSDRAVAFVPSFARYAYEIWVAPMQPCASLTQLTDEDLSAMARCLKTAILKLDNLFAKPMPYVLALHQSPSDGQLHPELHLHIEIYPALRMADRLKYLAGSEIGAGTFTSDTLPEQKAQELRAVVLP
jgi:UDPglucose--hexose-1-phosphate uridylyltransferase